MNESVEVVLRGIFIRHGSALLSHQRRCEGLIRDTDLSRKEIAGLLVALKSGIPARFAESPKSGLTTIALSTYAARLSDETGLDQDIARSSLEAWAYALGIGLAGRQPARETPPLEQEREQAGGDSKVESMKDTAPPSKDDAVPRSAGPRRGGWLAVLFAIQGLLLVGAQGYPDPLLTIAAYATGCLCLLAGAMLLRQVAWVKWPAVALSALVLLLAFAGVQMLGVAFALPMIVAGYLGVAGLAGSLFWRADGRQGVSASGGTPWASVLVLLAASWNILTFGVALGGVVEAVEIGYIFHMPRLLWLWINLPISLGLVWLAWSVLAGQRATLPRIIAAILFGVSAVLGVLDLIIMQVYGGHDYWPWDPQLAPVVGLIADLAVAGFLIMARLRDRKRRPKETALA